MRLLAVIKRKHVTHMLSYVICEFKIIYNHPPYHVCFIEITTITIIIKRLKVLVSHKDFFQKT